MSNKYNADVENFVATFKSFNDALEKMRQIKATYKKRLDLDAKDVE